MKKMRSQESGFALSKSKKSASPQSLKRSVSAKSKDFARSYDSLSPHMTGDEILDSVMEPSLSRQQIMMQQSVSSSLSGFSPKRSQSILNSTIITKKLNSGKASQQHSKTVIKMLGLNLEAVCNKPGHEQNRIVFICKKLNCPAPNRLGCAHCFLQEHNDHSIDRYNIQDFCTQFDQQVQRFRQIVQDLQKIDPRQKALATAIQTQFEQFRELIQNQLFQLEQSVLQQVQDVMTQHNSWVAIASTIEKLNEKNLFTMDTEEQQQAIDLLHSKQISELLSIKESVFDHHNEQDFMIKDAWQRFDRQFQNDMVTAIKDNPGLIFPLPDKQQEAIRRITQLESRKQLIDTEYFKNQKIIKDIEKIITDQLELKASQRQILLKRQQDEQARLEKKEKDEKREREEHERHKKIVEKLADLKKKEQDQLRQEEERLKKIKATFPYQLYEKTCNHIQPCNTIPVFACCNRSFPCQTCHGNQYHPPQIVQPSVRYCVKCLEIYLVPYATTQAVNCLKCLNK